MVSDPNQLRYPAGYICPKCKAELHDRYRPFCGECGQQMPTEQKLQEVGLTVYPYRYGSPVESINGIESIVNGIGPTNYWLAEYHPTFRTTRIRIQSNSKQSYDYELICTSTIRLELPINDGWFGIVTVTRQLDEMVRLSDDENKVLVTAGSVSLYTVFRT